MSRPNTLPSWCDDDAASKVIEPSGTKKLAGFKYKERAAFQYVNWLFRNLVKWITFLDEERVVNYTTPVLVGSALSFAAGEVSMTQLDKNTIAYIDDTNDQLRTYRFNGDSWSLIGSAFALTHQTPAIAALNSTDLVFASTSTDALQAYRFNGSTWSTLGSSFSLGTVLQPEMTSLNSTDVAYFDSNNDELRTYRFNGSTWSLVGTGLSFTGEVFRMTTLNATDIAVFEVITEELRTYRFNGSTWSQVGNSLSMPTSTSLSVIAALNSTDVIIHQSAPIISAVYRFDGSDWVAASYASDISALGKNATSLNSTDFVVASSTDLSVYRYGFYLGGQPHLPQ